MKNDTSFGHNENVNNQFIYCSSQYPVLNLLSVTPYLPYKRTAILQLNYINVLEAYFSFEFYHTNNDIRNSIL